MILKAIRCQMRRFLNRPKNRLARNWTEIAKMWPRKVFRWCASEPRDYEAPSPSGSRLEPSRRVAEYRKKMTVFDMLRR